jgi:hypothetical protein
MNVWVHTSIGLSAVSQVLLNQELLNHSRNSQHFMEAEVLCYLSVDLHNQNTAKTGAPLSFAVPPGFIGTS